MSARPSPARAQSVAPELPIWPVASAELDNAVLRLRAMIEAAYASPAANDQETSPPAGKGR